MTSRLAARRLASLAVALLLGLSLTACGGDDDNGGSGSGSGSGTGSETAEAPVDLGTAVNNEGSTDLGSETSASVDMELDDNYFKPTFVKATPGATVTVNLENEGGSTHTFTIEGSDVSEELSSGDTAQVEVTVPDDGALEFRCRFHGGAGMVGAFYSEDGQTVTNADAESTSSGGGGYSG
jgi:plastocyanin